MKIAVIDDYADAFRKTGAFPRLQGHQVTVFRDSEKDPAKQAARLRGFDAVVLTQQRTRIPRALVEQLEGTRLICQTGRYTAHIDLAACTEKGIVVSAGGGGSSNTTAELTWGLIIASLRHLPFEIEQMKRGHWQSTSGTALQGKVLGIYAFGKIGSIVAAVGRAFQMKVICWGRAGSLERARAAGFDVAPSREAFFESADVLSLHIPLNDATRGIVTAADLARMKPTALLVNTSRAPLVESGALVDALKKRRPGFAAVDVFEEEPVLGDHPLLKMDNALCAPHLGYATTESYETMYGSTVEQLLAFERGEPVEVANPEALAKR
jgi:D-3-phosphoglycerate dehydrogenase